MLKKIYLTAWTLLASAVIAWVITGKLNPIAVTIFSFLAFALFYIFTLWLASFDTGNTQPKYQVKKTGIHMR